MINLTRVVFVAGTTLYFFLSVFVLAGFISAAFISPAQAASCCGGGTATSLILPKFSRAMLDASIDYEHYDGFWDTNGNWTEDPLGSNLNQYRLNLGYAHRLNPNWQASVTLPYVWNQNQYASLERNTSGIGDGAVSLWYEAFDKIACVWDVRTWRDLLPAVYLGGSLKVPTGTSPYDDVVDNFDITGRGFYRLDASILIDKTIYPWTLTVGASYGKYLERPVNREFGTYVEPYRKQLGDRFNSVLSLGYTYFTDEMESLTGTLAYAYLEEDEGKIDGVIDTTSGFRKQSIAATLAWATDDRDWITKLTWSHAPSRDGWGRNFPTTDIITVGVSHVFR